jgi:hypothetical protein
MLLTRIFSSFCWFHDNSPFFMIVLLVWFIWLFILVVIWFWLESLALFMGVCKTTILLHKMRFFFHRADTVFTLP